MANRHLARSTVLQTLYEWDFSGQKIEPAIILTRDANEFAPGMNDGHFMENLLNVSRIERGQVEISEKCLNWIAVVKSVVELFIEKAQSMKVTIEIDERAVGNLKVHADEIMIREVLANLLDNAVGYNKEGGKVIFSFDRAGDFVNTHIKDTGAGIPQESLPHVFKKFYRASGILEQGKKGTGLGLFIAKEIVRLHGGKIWLESRRNEGSTFSFSLPVCND